MTKFQRVYEAAILRTLGASTRLLDDDLALEYSALGLLAGTIGAAGALGLSWGVTRHVFDIPWRPAPGLLAVGAVLTTRAGLRDRRDRERRCAEEKAAGDTESRVGSCQLSALSCQLSARHCQLSALS